MSFDLRQRSRSEGPSLHTGTDFMEFLHGFQEPDRRISVTCRSKMRQLEGGRDEIIQEKIQQLEARLCGLELSVGCASAGGRAVELSDSTARMANTSQQLGHVKKIERLEAQMLKQMQEMASISQKLGELQQLQHPSLVPPGNAKRQPSEERSNGDMVDVVAAGSTNDAVYFGPKEDAPGVKGLSEEDRIRSNAVASVEANGSINMGHQKNDDTSVQGNIIWDCGDNFHAWCVVHATKRDANPCMAVSFMSVSLFFVLIQLILLASLILESSFARCSQHDHCHQGEWCSPALAGAFSTAPGVCFDCWSAEMFYEARFLNAPYEVSPDPYELMASAAGDQWLLDGSRHCNSTDTFPRRCDFLVYNLQNMTPLSMMIFIVMASLIVADIVDELDEIEGCENLTWHRSMRVDKKKKRKYIVMAMSWLSCTLRRWVLPMMTVGATLGLILRESLTASNLLLNGLSISFVTSLDDTLVSLVYFRLQKAEDLPRFDLSFLTWFFHRLFAVFMFAAFVGTIVNAEDLLVDYGNEAKYGAVCSDLREIVTVFSFYVCLSFAFLHAVLRTCLWVRSHQAKHPQLDMYEFLSAKLHADVPWSFVWVLAKFILDLLVPPFLVWYFRNAFVAQGPLVILQIGDAIWTNPKG